MLLYLEVLFLKIYQSYRPEILGAIKGDITSDFDQKVFHHLDVLF